VTSRDDSLRSAAASATELARAAAFSRVARGAAHALAEAVAGLLEETQLLQDARKDDAAVDEACLALRSGLDRCARIARLLLERHAVSPGAAGAAASLDLARVLTRAAPLIEHVLVRRVPFAFQKPDEPLLARADEAAIEALLLLLVQHAESLVQGGPVRLLLRARRSEEDETVALEVVVQDATLAPEAERSLTSARLGRGVPEDDARGVGGLTLVALHGVADAQRARLEIEREGDALVLRAVLAALEDGA